MSIFLNLVVIRSINIEKSVSFYQHLGLMFNKERHGNGPEHYACELENLVFEIYPSTEIDVNTRIGFNVESLEEIVNNIRAKGGLIITEPISSPWGKRAVLQDPDGHKVELLQPTSEEQRNG